MTGPVSFTYFYTPPTEGYSRAESLDFSQFPEYHEAYQELLQDPDLIELISQLKQNIPRRFASVDPKNPLLKFSLESGDARICIKPSLGDDEGYKVPLGELDFPHRIARFLLKLDRSRPVRPPPPASPSPSPVPAPAPLAAPQLAVPDQAHAQPPASPVAAHAQPPHAQNALPQNPLPYPAPAAQPSPDLSRMLAQQDRARHILMNDLTAARNDLAAAREDNLKNQAAAREENLKNLAVFQDTLNRQNAYHLAALHALHQGHQTSLNALHQEHQAMIATLRNETQQLLILLDRTVARMPVNNPPPNEQMEPLHELIRELRQDIAALGRRNDELHDHLRGAERDGAGFRVESALARQQIGHLRDRLRELEEQLRVAQQPGEAFRAERDQARQQIDQLRGELENQLGAAQRAGEGFRAESQQERNLLQVRIRELENQLGAAQRAGEGFRVESGRFQERIRDLEELNRQLRQQFDRANLDVRQLEQDLGATRTTIAQGNQQQHSQLQELNRIRSILSEQDTRFAQMRNQLVQPPAPASAPVQPNPAEQELQQAQQRVAELSGQLQHLQSQLAAQAEQLNPARLIGDLTRAQQETQRLREELQRARQENEELLRRYQSAVQDLEAAVQELDEAQRQLEALQNGERHRFSLSVLRPNIARPVGRNAVPPPAAARELLSLGVRVPSFPRIGPATPGRLPAALLRPFGQMAAPSSTPPTEAIDRRPDIRFDGDGNATISYY